MSKTTKKPTDSQPEDESESVVQDGVEDIDGRLEVLPVNYEISFYGVDFPVDGLVKRLRKDDIQIPTFDPEFHGDDDIAGFQRDFMWTKPQSDRFIESLLLG